MLQGLSKGHCCEVEMQTTRESADLISTLSIQSHCKIHDTYHMLINFSRNVMWFDLSLYNFRQLLSYCGSRFLWPLLCFGYITPNSCSLIPLSNMASGILCHSDSFDLLTAVSSRTDSVDAFMQRYTIDKIIGRGQFSQVFRAQCKENGSCIALKKVKVAHEQHGYVTLLCQFFKVLSHI